MWAHFYSPGHADLTANLTWHMQPRCSSVAWVKLGVRPVHAAVTYRVPDDTIFSLFVKVGICSVLNTGIYTCLFPMPDEAKYVLNDNFRW
jgi:hypothetical protein